MTALHFQSLKMLEEAFVLLQQEVRASDISRDQMLAVLRRVQDGVRDFSRALIHGPAEEQYRQSSTVPAPSTEGNGSTDVVDSPATAAVFKNIMRDCSSPLSTISCPETLLASDDASLNLPTNGRSPSHILRLPFYRCDELLCRHSSIDCDAYGSSGGPSGTPALSRQDSQTERSNWSPCTHTELALSPPSDSGLDVNSSMSVPPQRRHEPMQGSFEDVDIFPGNPVEDASPQGDSGETSGNEHVMTDFSKAGSAPDDLRGETIWQEPCGDSPNVPLFSTSATERVEGFQHGATVLNAQRGIVLAGLGQARTNSVTCADPGTDSDAEYATCADGLTTPSSDILYICANRDLALRTSRENASMLNMESCFSDCVVNRIPKRFFIQPEKVLDIFHAKLQHKGSNTPLLLTRLFYAMASPSALCQLRDALRAARQAYLPGISHPVTSLMTTMESLDRLDSVSAYGHISRRFLLVRLLKLRLEREVVHRTATKTAPASGRVLKHDLKRIESIKKGLDPHVDSHQGVQKLPGRKRRADSQALMDLLSIPHPEASHERGPSTGPEIEEYPWKMRKLRHRLACARNWFILSESFSPGILALIPQGGEYQISIDQVEKLPKEDLKLFIKHLKATRGEFLKEISNRLTEHVSAILSFPGMRKDRRPFEKLEDDELMKTPYDSEDLICLCSQEGGLEEVTAHAT